MERRGDRARWQREKSKETRGEFDEEDPRRGTKTRRDEITPCTCIRTLARARAHTSTYVDTCNTHETGAEERRAARIAPSSLHA